jgi:hypothetical protein
MWLKLINSEYDKTILKNLWIHNCSEKSVAENNRVFEEIRQQIM